MPTFVVCKVSIKIKTDNVWDLYLPLQCVKKSSG